MVRPPVVKVPIIPVHSGKILDLAIFSSQEALSLHFSFKLGVTINLLSSIGSLLILNVLKAYVCAITYLPRRILLQQFSLGTRPHKS